ncbi:hypothetical protein DSO57_1018225 [Entomophthora muscae]|uniref:Uncharacterized protein n=1 Tax=Entomophthora muscae TaxID=34485 RepID=A0ACC2RVP6_9FUNG|nr:hypothetical protein DSO57_1018225 [Entomophthora muscae]
MSSYRANDWGQLVIETTSHRFVRFFVKKYVKPFAAVAPSPDVALKLVDIVKQLMLARPVIPQGLAECNPTLRREVCNRATQAFFHYFNPMLPLFSEEGFHSKPRSPLLRAIVVRIGLWRMRITRVEELLMEQIDREIDQERLASMPLNLEFVQCLLLIMAGFNIKASMIVRTRAYFTISSLITLLGLHVESSHDLERRLAFNALSLWVYQASNDQNTGAVPGKWLEETWSVSNFSPKLLPGLAQRRWFPFWQMKSTLSIVSAATAAFWG